MSPNPASSLPVAGQYALVIGVQQSGNLQPLPGAWSDADAFAEWADKSGYKVVSITDQAIPVTIDRLRNEVDAILKNEISRLLVFYAGHGICSQLGDYWLLSNFHRDGEEAVNVALSVRNARRLGVGQIAIFSDACRSSIASAAMIPGRALFRSPVGGARVQGEYDEFFSTDIGETAQEEKSHGVFSRCLLTALHCLEPRAVVDRDKRRVVTSQSLAAWLEQHVPLESGKIPGGTVQYPSITTSWRHPNDVYAEVGLSGDVASIDTLGSAGRRMLSAAAPEGLNWLERREQVFKAKDLVRKVSESRARQIDDRTAVFHELRGRTSFETGQGLTVIGAHIDRVVTPMGTYVDLFEEQGHWHVRGDGSLHSVALLTSDKRWLPATMLPGYIGTLVVGEQGIDSLSYRQPGQLNNFSNTTADWVVARWNALLGASRQASLPTDAFADLADRLRVEKHVNPALGILAAYAYERAGRLDQVANVAWYFAHRNRFVPFDVVWLLEQGGDAFEMIREYGYTPYPLVIAGELPLLTRGWGLAGSDARHERLAALRPGLRNSVWTTFDQEHGERLATLVHQGEL